MCKPMLMFRAAQIAEEAEWKLSPDESFVYRINEFGVPKKFDIYGSKVDQLSLQLSLMDEKNGGWIFMKEFLDSGMTFTALSQDFESLSSNSFPALLLDIVESLKNGLSG